jgi:hypothetical protein
MATVLLLGSDKYRSGYLLRGVKRDSSGKICDAVVVNGGWRLRIKDDTLLVSEIGRTKIIHSSKFDEMHEVEVPDKKCIDYNDAIFHAMDQLQRQLPKSKSNPAVAMIYPESDTPEESGKMALNVLVTWDPTNRKKTS